MIPLKHDVVVVPIDFSEDSIPAIQSACHQANDPHGVHVVHVLFALDTAASSLQREFATGRSREEVTRERLEELVRQADAEGAHTVVLAGDPGSQVTDYAAKVGAGLIVVPSHGFHGVKRLLLGSTAERIIRHANCSVLALRRADAD